MFMLGLQVDYNINCNVMLGKNCGNWKLNSI